MPAPWPANAIAACPITSGEWPSTFVKRTRTISPPTLLNTMLRMVWFANPPAPELPGAGASGLAAQVEIQRAPFGTYAARLTPRDRWC